MLGTLNGTRSGMLADCAGLVGGNIDLNAANALFLLAEQAHPELFPASALTYNRFNGTSLLRFYPASGVLVTVTGSELYLGGGPYGSELRRIGAVDELTRMLETRMPGFVPYAVAITGEVVVEIANLSQIVATGMNRAYSLRVVYTKQ